MNITLNREVLVSGAQFFDVVELNAYSHNVGPIDREKAITEHLGILATLKEAGIQIVTCEAPADCQDGIFTANWAFCHGDKAVLARLPGPRQAEEHYARQILEGLGKHIIQAPYRFSGQGDALRCGRYLFTGTGYRTDERIPQFLADTFPDLDVIALRTLPELDGAGKPVINKLSGWPDSYFYDIDLALSVLREDLIGWCPQAFTQESREKIRSLPINKIEVSLAEAIHGMACNLVSTGETVIMSARAPQYREAIEAHGLTTITPETAELAKGGGSIRCTTLTLS